MCNTAAKCWTRLVLPIVTSPPITVDERAAIIDAVCGVPLGVGKRDDRISHGIFAAVLAIWGGATDVVLAGFSMAGGHATSRARRYTITSMATGSS